MNFYCIKCLMFIKNNNIKLKCKIDAKVNLYSCCIGYGFKKFATIDKEELRDLLRYLI